MARPSKFTDEVTQNIIDAIKAGNYSETAANFAGISASTFYTWLDRGRTERERLNMDPDAEPDEDEAKYAEFAEKVEEARAAAEVRAVTLIQRAGADTWQAAAWYLERSAPGRWARRERHEVTGADGGPVAVKSHTRVEVDVDRTAGILDAFVDAGIIPELAGPAEEPGPEDAPEGGSES